MTKFDVLSVEDEEDTMVGTISELNAEGLTVDTASSMELARKKLKENDYAILLVDLRLPETDEGDIVDRGGIALLRELKHGDLGSVNQDKNFFVVTAQGFLLYRFRRIRGEFDQGKARDVDGCLEIIGKGDSVFAFVRRIRAAVELQRMKERHG